MAPPLCTNSTEVLDLYKPKLELSERQHLREIETLESLNQLRFCRWVASIQPRYYQHQVRSVIGFQFLLSGF